MGVGAATQLLMRMLEKTQPRLLRALVGDKFGRPKSRQSHCESRPRREDEGVGPGCGPASLGAARRDAGPSVDLLLVHC